MSIPKNYIFFSRDEEDEDDEDNPNFRRAKKHHTMNRSNMYSSEKESDASSSASAVEKNPGNPFTIHKNKYRQNWLWNHFMDGDHMNINPFGPHFQSLGPSGPELFFGRKWWYFNQDDYKPMG
ncbi:uncharacterized protein LOC113492926 [Trichoplusia ni]|uniref:Uncharacterized protein LOC113492926 n=1 Tax=Trichoplusia ni TaxID=7111 RepID=A0A7E5VDT2_TRINI|nr:uncharacterized protein LOC113492926 [Trichoplusia ni]